MDLLKVEYDSDRDTGAKWPKRAEWRAIAPDATLLLNTTSVSRLLREPKIKGAPASMKMAHALHVASATLIRSDGSSIDLRNGAMIGECYEALPAKKMVKINWPPTFHQVMPSAKKTRARALAPVATEPMEKKIIRALDSDGYLKGRRTRMRIVEVASRQFSARGYTATSVEQIAVAAGMTKGAVSGHFKRKRDLYVACLEHTLAFFHHLPSIDPKLAPDKALLAYLYWLGSALYKASSARSFMIQIMRDVDNDLRAEIASSMLTAPFFALRKLIEAVNHRIDSAAYAFIVFSALLLDADQHHIYALVTQGKASPHDMEATVRRLASLILTARES